MTKPIPRPLRFQALGRLLARRRFELEISQYELSALTGISRSQIINLESGASLPTLPTLYALAGALQCKPAELLP